MSDSECSDAELRAHWERILSTQTEASFREFVLEHLPIRHGDAVLSAGCGPGFETAALAEQVGETGRVTGIDVNQDVLAAARDRCRDLPQVSFHLGDVTDLPVADESLNLAVAKQVLVGVSDVESALAELFRVLEPGGRVAITGGDRRTHVKHTPTERMRRADEIFRTESGGSRLGTRLVSMLPEAGFTSVDVEPRAKIQTEITDQIERGIEVQRAVLESSEAFDDDEIATWERDLRDLGETGRFLSCSTVFLYVARKPP